MKKEKGYKKNQTNNSEIDLMSYIKVWHVQCREKDSKNVECYAIPGGIKRIIKERFKDKTIIKMFKDYYLYGCIFDENKKVRKAISREYIYYKLVDWELEHVKLLLNKPKNQKHGKHHQNN